VTGEDEGLARIPQFGVVGSDVEPREVIFYAWGIGLKFQRDLELVDGAGRVFEPLKGVGQALVRFGVLGALLHCLLELLPGGAEIALLAERAAKEELTVGLIWVEFEGLPECDL